MPPIPRVEVFGLHMNAGIVRDLMNTKQFLESLMLVEGGMISGGVGESVSLLYEIAADILRKVGTIKELTILYKIFDTWRQNLLSRCRSGASVC